MDHYFTPEGIQLATFKMCLENNAMLHTSLNILSRIIAILPKEDHHDQMEEIKLEYESLIKRMAEAYEIISTEKAASFAADHDSSLDDVITLNT